jgi:4-hydroxybutyrate CoA-transferase
VRTPTPVTAREVAGVLPAGACVYVQAGAGQPIALLEAIRDDGSGDQWFVTAGFPGVNEFALDTLGARTRSTVFYPSRSLAAGLARGQVTHVPLHHSEIARYLDETARPDVLMVQVSPPDAQGLCSLVGGPDVIPHLLVHARIVLAEVNARMSRTPDAPALRWDQITHALQTDRELAALPQPAPDELAEAVARNAAALIDDGDCLQVGIGGLPGALLAQLDDRRDLGVHSGIVGDGLARLIASGAVTGARKPAAHPRAVSAYVTGSAACRIAESGALALRTPAFTHSAEVIGEIDRFVSIGAALEIDLFGQVNAEHAAGRAISGTGGFMDFLRGARLSHGGRSIVMLQSANRQGQQGRIVAALRPGTPVTCTRADVDVVVTEHGVASLRHLSAAERARRLIDIAHPALRDELSREWEQLRRS